MVTTLQDSRCAVFLLLGTRGVSIHVPEYAVPAGHVYQVEEGSRRIDVTEIHAEFRVWHCCTIPSSSNNSIFQFPRTFRLTGAQVDPNQRTPLLPHSGRCPICAGPTDRGRLKRDSGKKIAGSREHEASERTAVLS